MTDWLQLGSSLLGAYAGNKASQGSTTTSSQTKDPWAPAQPYLLQNLQSNADLQDWYTKNPFNAQQKTGLQNTLNSADHFNASVAPGLMDFANGAMTSGYQRQRGGAPGSGGGYGGAVQPGGLLRSGSGPFSAAPMQKFGQVDWNAVNPMTNGHASGLSTQRNTAIQALMDAAPAYAPDRNSGGGGMGDGYTGIGGGSYDGVNGFGSSLNASNSIPRSISNSTLSAIGALSPALAVALGLGNEAGLFGSTYNGYGKLDGTTAIATGPGTIGVRDYYGSNQDFNSGVASGGGWSSLSSAQQASISNAADPIGAFANAIGMGGGLGGLGGGGPGDASGGFM